MEFDDGKIFIKDTNHKIFVFDEEGRFLNTIGKTGAGPDEQWSVFDFYIDKKSKSVTVFDIHKSTLFRYTYSGDLTRKEKINHTLFSNVSSIIPADDGHLILILNNDNTSLFNFGVLDIQKKKRKDEIPYPATGNKTLSFGISKTDNSGGSIYMCAFMSDTIYTYDPDSKNIIPEWVFGGRLMPATQKDIGGKTYDLALEAIPVAKNKHLSTGINRLYTTDNYIHFTFSMDNSKYYRAFFNKKTRTGSYYKITPAGIYTSLDNLIATTDSAFVCFIPAYEALTESLDGHPNLKEILDITVEDDNPILAFYYLN
jgi:hypothetical protein